MSDGYIPPERLLGMPLENLDGGAEEENTSPESRKDFIKYYLDELKGVLQGFEVYFGVIGVFYAIQAIASFALSLVLMTEVGAVAGISILITSLNIMMIWWFASLSRQFVKIQVEKVESDLRSDEAFKSNSIEMSKEILKRSRKRAETIVTSIKIGGENKGNINVVTGDHNDVRQAISQNDAAVIRQGLALMLAVCEENGNKEAIKLSKKIVREAEKDEKNKSIIFDAWTKLVSLVPTVSSVVSITNGIRTLLG